MTHGIYALLFWTTVLLLAALSLWQWWDARGEEMTALPLVEELTTTWKEGLAGISEGTQLLLGDLVTTAYRAGEAAPSATGKPTHARTILSTWNRNDLVVALRRKGFSDQRIKSARHYFDYIDQYKVAALRDMQRSGVSASITLAQGLLESNAGRSRLARRSNNHFGIKARQRASARAKIQARQYSSISDADFAIRKPATGVVRFHDDYRYDRFETYASVYDSYQRHSDLLTSNCTQARKGCYAWIWEAFPVGQEVDITVAARRYQSVCGIAAGQFFGGKTRLPYYAAQAAGLKMAGYATAARYHQHLAYLIDTYELWRFDLDLLRASGTSHQ